MFHPSNENPLVVEYDPKWIEEFDALAVVLAEAFGALASNIYHVGSTAIPDRYAYRNTSPAVPFSKHRTSWMHHHLYVCPHDSTELARMLLFRDKLRNSAELRKEYIELKQKVLRLAKGVRQIYVDEKARLGDDFFKRVLNS